MVDNLDTDYPGSKKNKTGNEDLKKQLVQDFETDGGVLKHDFPTEMIDLPSGGVLYEKDNPLRSGKVEIKYMTAKEEDILTSQNLIQQGVVIDKLLKALVVGSIPYHKLLLGDKNAIMVAAKVKVDLQELKHKNGLDNAKFEEGINKFEFELPVSKKKLTWKILNHGDEVKIGLDLKKSNRGKRKDDPRQEFTKVKIHGSSS